MEGEIEVVVGRSVDAAVVVVVAEEKEVEREEEEEEEGVGRSEGYWYCS